VVVPGKRPFDHEDAEGSQRRRFHKRARIQESSSEPRTKVTKAVNSTNTEKKHLEKLTLKDSSARDDAPQRISFSLKDLKISSQNVKLFERRIIPQPETISPPLTPDNKVKRDKAMPQ